MSLVKINEVLNNLNPKGGKFPKDKLYSIQLIEYNDGTSTIGDMFFKLSDAINTSEDRIRTDTENKIKCIKIFLKYPYKLFIDQDKYVAIIRQCINIFFKYPYKLSIDQDKYIAIIRRATDSEYQEELKKDQNIEKIITTFIL